MQYARLKTVCINKTKEIETKKFVIVKKLEETIEGFVVKTAIVHFFFQN